MYDLALMISYLLKVRAFDDKKYAYWFAGVAGAVVLTFWRQRLVGSNVADFRFCVADVLL